MSATATPTKTPVAAAVDPRIQARRDEVDQARQRRRRHLGLALLGALLLVVAGWWVLRGPLLAVRRVEVVPTAHLSEATLRATASVAPGDHLLGLDTGAIAHRLEALPWVDRADVSTTWGGRVRITVKERRGVLVVANTPGQPWILADAQGRALGTTTAPPPGALPVRGVAPVAPGRSFGSALAGPREIVGRLTPGLRTRVRAVLVAPDGTLQLQLQPGGIAQLCAPAALERKLADLTTWFAHVDDRNLATVDVCTQGSVFVTRVPTP